MIISIPSSAIGKALCPRFPYVQEKSDKSNPEVEMVKREITCRKFQRIHLPYIISKLYIKNSQ